jgi:Lipoprotein LpqB beta-propeller domain/Sporulation and spore germination
MSRALSVALAAALGLLLAACGNLSTTLTAQVPTSGPIQQGEKVSGGTNDQFIRVIARPPSPGMTPSQLIQGFLDASASFEGDHFVARQYLTKEASDTWDPSTVVRVFEGSGTLTETGRVVTFAASQAATISANGSYRVSEAGATLLVGYDVIRVEGEWRISSLPSGLVLSQPDVERTFRSLAVYFFNPSFTHLVPDPRLIPVYGPAQATTLTRYLLAGPSEWLQPAVRTGFPDGVRLNLESVPVVSGVAQVDLNRSARLASDEARVSLSEQLVWTLAQLSDVDSVSITAAGEPFLVPGVASPQPRDAWPEVNPDAMPVGATGYVAQTAGAVTLTGEGTSPVPGPAGKTDFLDIAVSGDNTTLAGIDTKGNLIRTLMTSRASRQRIDLGGAASAPAFGPNGSLWAVAAGKGLMSVDERGVVTPITVSGLPKRSFVLAAIPARDGARVALVVRTGARTRLLLARVTSGGPASSSDLTVSEPIRVEKQLTSVVDVAWANADELLVLGNMGGSELQSYTVNLADGSVVNEGGVPGAVSIAAAPGLPHLMGSAEGKVFEVLGGAWLPRTSGVAPAYPG